MKLEHLALLLLCLLASGVAQTDPNGGVPRFSTQLGGQYDSVNPATSNIFVSIPLRSKQGKIPFSVNLVSNFHMSITTDGNGFWFWNPPLPSPFVNKGHSLFVPQISASNLGATLDYSFHSVPFACKPGRSFLQFDNFAVVDETGARHPTAFTIIYTDPSCGAQQATTKTIDGSGYTVNLAITNDALGGYTFSYTLIDKSGNVNTPTTTSTYGATVTDPDGVQATSTITIPGPSGPTGLMTDSLGQTLMTVSYPNPNTPGSPAKYEYTDANGQTQTFTVNYSQYTLQLNFGCTPPPVGNYPQDGGAVTTFYPSSVVTPDGGMFSIEYEPTPGHPSNITGRIAKLTLPLGGSISYTYSGGNNGEYCITSPLSPVVPILTRTVNDGNGNISPWTYVNTNTTGSLGNYTVTETDPLNNVTVYTFTGTYETQRQIYQGSVSPQHLLKTVVTCYNGNFSNCPAASIPFVSGLGEGVSQTDVYTYLNGSPSGSLVETKFNLSSSIQTGTVAEVKEYDFGVAMPPSGPPVRDTTTSYGSWNGSSCSSITNIVDHPCVVTVIDSSGSTVAQTRYTYNAAGHPTQISRLVSGSTFVTTSATYATNGTLATSTDANGTITHYTNGACNGMLPTQTSVANITTSQTWDCNGGVITSTTDANSKVTSYDYQGLYTTGHPDPFWRVTSVTYPDTGRTTGTYHPLSTPPNITTTKSIDSTHTLTTQATFDGLGRVVQKSITSDPDGTDMIDTTYDGLGRAASVSNPHRSTGSATDGITLSQYDALGRVTQTTRQDGSIAIASYVGSCAITTDEAVKQRKACSDGLGRLVEVDEPGASPPAQNNYLTMQTDGNFVEYNSSNAAVWSTGTAGTNAANFEVQDDGNLVVYIFKWQAGVYATPSQGPFTPQTCTIGGSLNAPQTLTSGQCITSPKGQYMLYMAPDGNFYIYDIAHNIGTWGAGTSGNPGAYAAMQTDGNFVVYSAGGTALWNSGTNGTFSERLQMEDDGRIIIYKSAWSSGTAQGAWTGSISHPGCDVGASVGQTGVVNTGQCLVSRNGRYELLMQSDGNLVLTDRSVSPASSTWSSGTAITPLTPGIALQTLYTYNALGDLTCVEQHGTSSSGTGCSSPPSLDATSPWRIRRFTYDALSRLLNASNPESNTATVNGAPVRVNATYTYDANGNLLQKTSPAPNQTSSATQTISYCYDTLNRVTGKAYSAQTCQNGQLPPGTAVVSYTYDQGANGIGRLTSLTDQAGSGSYSYDTMGREATEQRTIAGVTKSISYVYNPDGSIKNLTYPSNRIVNYTYNSAARVLSVIDGNGTQYVSNATYWSNSHEYQQFMPNIYLRTDLNKRLQISGFYSDNGQVTGYYINKTYSYNDGHNNGDVMSIANIKDSNRTQSFTYDALNRIASGSSQSNAGSLSWGETYSIDAWGNLQIAPMAGKAHGGNFQHAGDINNRPTGLSYDAAGNLTSYLSTAYIYDAENRLQSAAGMKYTYDADSKRALKSQNSNNAPVKRYWSGAGDVLAEDDGTGTLASEYIYFGGSRVARIDLPGNAMHYYLSDHLNSTSIVVNAIGAPEEESDYSPYGTEVVVTGPGANHYKFTGKERDSETQLDYFGARYYSSSLGRFVTPDWSTQPINVPYAQFDNPQSLNLYTFVKNDPVTLVDSDGHLADESFAVKLHVIDCTIQRARCDMNIELKRGETAAFHAYLMYGEESQKIAGIPADYPSVSGMEFVMSWEKYRATPYDDGLGIMTIGYGHVILAKDSFTSMTQKQAEDLFYHDTERFIKQLNAQLTRPVDQAQFDALFSVRFNGPRGGGILTNFFNVTGALTLKNFTDTIEHHQGDSVYNGLKNRRSSEYRIWSEGKYVNHQ